MRKMNLEYLYEFSSQGVDQPEKIKKHADRAVSDILSKYGKDIDIKLHIKPESKRRKVYKLTMSSKFGGREVIVQKSGRNIYSMIKYLKRKFMRSFRSVERAEYMKIRKVSPIKMLHLDEAI